MGAGFFRDATGKYPPCENHSPQMIYTWVWRCWGYVGPRLVKGGVFLPQWAPLSWGHVWDMLCLCWPALGVYRKVGQAGLGSAHVFQFLAWQAWWLKSFLSRMWIWIWLWSFKPGYMFQLYRNIVYINLYLSMYFCTSLLILLIPVPVCLYIGMAF